ncbi:MAG: hypothetical protein AAFR93_11520 [Pseudomonadota bacterium]
MTLLDSLFVIFIAGCSHDGAQCGPLHAERLEVPSFTACEAALDARLAAITNEWPVTVGSCAQASGVQPDLPAWYPVASAAERLS